MRWGGVIEVAARRSNTAKRRIRAAPNTAFQRISEARRQAARPSAKNLCPELDCVRAILPRHIIAAAERRAREIGIGADRVLICADAITEEAYLRALAAWLGTTFDPLDRLSRADCLVDDRQLVQAASTGLLPVRERGRTVFIIAPRQTTARNLADPRWRRPLSLGPYRLTTTERLSLFAARHTRKTLGRQASEALRRDQPLFSNAPRRRSWAAPAALAIATLALASVAFIPAATIAAGGALLCAAFLSGAGLRLWSALHQPRYSANPARVADDRLPIYTIICALYREANVAANLIKALRALDYPIEKLDIKLVLEADDRETRLALDLLDLGPSFEIMTAPAFGPRTKPKALNVALPLARGVYTAVYDAEDAPDPDQLRRAVAAFMANDDRLACLQASLTIDNTSDGWLARIFTANYAGQFDVLLPGLAASRLPFPLGGSSNHFRTQALRMSGGWDPYNVTEDADLGIRLHRLGYRAASLPSATFEEAPARFAPWLRQRTRWYKGWMQTWRVHMRRPFRLVRDLGVRGAAAFQLVLGCNILAALVHPFFMAGLGVVWLTQPSESITAMGPGAPLFAAALLAGYASTIALDLVGLQRRGLLRHSWVLLLTPLHWLLLSLAAWRALFQLLYDPQGWEKTEHGLARHSRRGEMK